MSSLMMHIKNILRKNLQMQIVVATFVLTIITAIIHGKLR